MAQLPLFVENSSWSVTELTRYLRDLFESDANLQDAWVQGEVSNFSRPASGHWYFTLKDSTSSLRCVMWRNTAVRQSFQPRDGQAVSVHGSLGIYEASGQYQLYADMIRPAGEGALYQEFLRLKARLEAEGLFDPERKRPIPSWPGCIGIITSPTGAALRDMLNTLRRRYPLVKIVLAPTPVQGDEAPAGIVAALKLLNEQVQPDVILVARGGGSIEDLWAFNNELVARAVAASASPVISGVGHETDFTIIDFVSDLRAPTPTAAAELATPNQADLRNQLDEQRSRLARSCNAIQRSARWELERLQNALRLHTPQARIRSGRQRVDELAHRSMVSSLHYLQLQRSEISSLQQHLAALNPLNVLQRGFAVVHSADGTLVRSIQQVRAGQNVDIRLADGQFEAQVLSANPAHSGSEAQA